MKKKIAIIITLALSLVTGALATGCSSKNTSQQPKSEVQNGKVVLKLAHAAQTTHPFNIGAEKFAELVDKKSNGNIKIEVYPSRQLGDDTAILQQVMGGTLDMGVISSPIFSKFTPLLDSLQLPFLLNSYDKELKAIKSPEMKAILDNLKTIDLKGLAVYEGGIRHIGNNKKPINTPEDLKGLKLRVVPSPLIIDTFKTLGANPTPMDYGEIYTGLQSNVIDGEEINLTSVYSEKHYEVLKYLTEVSIYPFPGINVMSSKVYESLSEENKKIIEEASWEAMDYVIEKIKPLEEEAMKTINAKVKTNKLQDVNAFKEKVKPLYDTYTSKDPLIKNFVDMANKLQ